ncbi:putative phosphoribosyl transferase [Hamadaea flava]|uniref:Phosphoribosyltransferase n=1 Tax=Hamadaea flava TaxID=1742688 RepID=A0ABV8LKH6_9ACTN|nr:phosphoribosyltransferase family protein [Hamadaea flava]MCP2323768.1 putative phosphoribosyl transferase [Hamadaea flava]
MNAFRDRADAGRRLAARLVEAGSVPARAERGEVVVLGLPRGGVPVAAEIAAVLGAPLDVIVVRKLGHPEQPEFAVGAIGEENARILTAGARGLPESAVAHISAVESAELDRRVRRLRGDRPPVPLQGRTALIVDDGIATGATAAVACQVARARGATSVIVAAPVAPPGAIADLAPLADEVIAVVTPDVFHAVGAWYDDFSATTDDEVAAILTQPA